MKKYANEHGDSGVTGYEAGSGFIRVRFVNGITYEYTNASAGAANIKAMTRCAEAGRGLATYIQRHVKDRFARKITGEK
ncbi:hypothetical protein [Pedobacter sp. SYP-B3415]|uniref:hypothetical protein n=1 Tax=Pedobacter sp. SYP-B3415 TaxID=2496641 RepID=UPI00101D86BD|nr:hypothetical protein [Pedobacter sp. SYP-B3415]